MQNERNFGVVFDLWNTLIPLSNELKQKAFIETAAVLGVKPESLKKTWQDTRPYRETQHLLKYFHWLNNELDAGWSDEKIHRAMEVRRTVHGSAFRTPDANAFEVLESLKSNGIQTALVSNCSSDVREMILSSEIAPLIDKYILSSEVGIMKPKKEIFEKAAYELGLTCEQCLYVGDGMDQELEGAANAGMMPVLIEREENNVWQGARIQTLTSLLEEVEVG